MKLPNLLLQLRGAPWIGLCDPLPLNLQVIHLRPHGALRSPAFLLLDNEAQILVALRTEPSPVEFAHAAASALSRSTCPFAAGAATDHLALAMSDATAAAIDAGSCGGT